MMMRALFVIFFEQEHNKLYNIQMKYISILIPAFTVSEDEDLVLRSNQQQTTADIFGISPSFIQLFQISTSQFAVKLKQLSLTTQSEINYQEIHNLYFQNELLKTNLQRSQCQFINLINQLEKKTTYQPEESIIKKQKKYRDLKQDNKKLRKLLKQRSIHRSQLENAEKMRQDTQRTVETLKHQFDQLVKELLSQKKFRQLQKKQSIRDIGFQNQTRQKYILNLDEGKRPLIDNFL